MCVCGARNNLLIVETIYTNKEKEKREKMVEPEYDSAYRRERHFERLIFMI